VAEGSPEADQNLEAMKAVLRELETESSGFPGRPDLTASTKLLLRYNDPTRGGLEGRAASTLLDGGVWRLGSGGRPVALVTIELYRKADSSRVVALEFLSLSRTKFALRHRSASVRWDATESALSLQPLPDAPKPAGTAGGRLVQMRQLARRFTATEQTEGGPVECRFLPQPIDRYESKEEKIVDGVIFAYANGTNPELGVLLETDGRSWVYGVIRMTAAPAKMALDGRTVAEFEHFNPKGKTEGPFHNTAYKQNNK
jgi:hypothetical protein